MIFLTYLLNTSPVTSSRFSVGGRMLHFFTQRHADSVGLPACTFAHMGTPHAHALKATPSQPPASSTPSCSGRSFVWLPLLRSVVVWRHWHWFIFNLSLIEQGMSGAMLASIPERKTGGGLGYRNKLYPRLSFPSRRSPQEGLPF